MELNPVEAAPMARMRLSIIPYLVTILLIVGLCSPAVIPLDVDVLIDFTVRVLRVEVDSWETFILAKEIPVKNI